MGRIDSITDMTGTLDVMDLNAQNIQQIIDELNRNSDQLDSIAKGINIIGRGTTTSVNHSAISVAHGFSQAPIFVASFTRSDQPGVYYPIPSWFYDVAGNYQGRVYAYTDSQSIVLTQDFVAAAPATITFSWYILQQPAQVPTGS